MPNTSPRRLHRPPLLFSVPLARAPIRRSRVCAPGGGPLGCSLGLLYGCSRRFYGRQIRKHLADKLLALPGVETGVPYPLTSNITVDTPAERAIVYFRFDGGAGAVMPVCD